MTEEKYICTACGHVGRPDRITKGSFLIEIVLWLFFIVPGLIYTIWRLTSKHSACPKCSNPTIIPVDTPKGQELIKLYSKPSESEQNLAKNSLAQKSVKRSPWKAIIIFILLPLALFTLIGLMPENSNEQQAGPTKKPEETSQSSKSTSKEQIIDENTSYTSKAINGVTSYAVLFNPPLKRDDYIVGKEIGRVIAHIYGVNTIADATPRLTEKNGVNLISLKANDRKSYLILLMKNENGSVWGIDLWKE